MKQRLHDLMQNTQFFHVPSMLSFEMQHPQLAIITSDEIVTDPLSEVSHWLARPVIPRTIHIRWEKVRICSTGVDQMSFELTFEVQQHKMSEVPVKSTPLHEFRIVQKNLNSSHWTSLSVWLVIVLEPCRSIRPLTCVSQTSELREPTWNS